MGNDDAGDSPFLRWPLVNLSFALQCKLYSLLQGLPIMALTPQQLKKDYLIVRCSYPLSSVIPLGLNILILCLAASFHIFCEWNAIKKKNNKQQEKQAVASPSAYWGSPAVDETCTGIRERSQHVEQPLLLANLLSDWLDLGWSRCVSNSPSLGLWDRLGNHRIV